jgi:hypothetical protein
MNHNGCNPNPRPPRATITCGFSIVRRPFSLDYVVGDAPECWGSSLIAKIPISQSTQLTGLPDIRHPLDLEPQEWSHAPEFALLPDPQPLLETA